MKTLLIAPALAGSLFLAGCNTTTDSAAVSAQIAAVQQTAVQICGYLPAVSTVTSIIATLTGFSPVNDAAVQVAQAICGAVTAKSVRRGGSAPMVRGVVIHGRFVR